MARIEYPDSWPQSDRDELDRLFEEARAKSLWFHAHHLRLWLSPDELQAKQEGGHLLYGPINWELRRPEDRLKQLLLNVHLASREVLEFSARMGVIDVTGN